MSKRDELLNLVEDLGLTEQQRIGTLINEVEALEEEEGDEEEEE
jgi:hypothetical protein